MSRDLSHTAHNAMAYVRWEIRVENQTGHFGCKKPGLHRPTEVKRDAVIYPGSPNKLEEELICSFVHRSSTGIKLKTFSVFELQE